jgi:hypothetical protein
MRPKTDIFQEHLSVQTWEKAVKNDREDFYRVQESLSSLASYARLKLRYEVPNNPGKTLLNQTKESIKNNQNQ